MSNCVVSVRGAVGTLPFTYMTTGLRRYGSVPVAPMVRPDWELQAILKGGARPWFPGPLDDERVADDRPRWYCFPPGHVHGWRAPLHDVSEVMVFHIRPQAVIRILPRNAMPDVGCVVLTELDVLRLRTVFDWLFPHLVQPDQHSALLMRGGVPLLWDVFRQSATPRRPDAQSSRSPAVIIDAATRLYRQDLLLHPTVSDIARGVGVSASQLRRIFARGGTGSPDQVLRGVRMDYARRLLVGTSLPIARIAEELGYNSPSAFTRAFKAHYHQTPKSLR